MNRFDVTEAIVAAKNCQGSQVGRHCQEGGPEQGMDDGCPTRADGNDRETSPRQWANCLDSGKEAVTLLQEVLTRVRFPPAVPTDPPHLQIL